MTRLQEISEATAFDNGDRFTSAAEVHDYFTVETQSRMFSGDCAFTQDELDDMAETVIDNGWHMEETA